MKRSSITLEKSKIDSIAIGGFDGLHIAHQELLANLGRDGAIVVIDRGGVSLTPGDTRSKFTKYPIYFLQFEDIRSMSGEEFVAYLKDKFRSLKKIVVGYDFRFGYQKSSSAIDLKRFFDGEVAVVDEIIKDGISVHSRVIKKALREYDLNLANRLLGRNYSIVSNQTGGQGIGKKELFATINLECGDFILPADGVYATYTKIEGKRFRSATFIGTRESTDSSFSIETHLIGEDIDIKDSDVEVEFVEFLRKNRKFDLLSDLKAQIGDDIDRAKRVLS